MPCGVGGPGAGVEAQRVPGMTPLPGMPPLPLSLSNLSVLKTSSDIPSSRKPP